MRPRRASALLALLAVAVALSCASGGSPKPSSTTTRPAARAYREVDYAITLRARPLRAEVRACFDQAPAALRPARDYAARFASPPAREGECFRYEVALEDAVLGDPRMVRREGEGWVISHHMLLWRPEKLYKARYRASVRAPEGWAVSAPWTSDEDGYALGASCFRRRGWLVVGPAVERAIAVPGGQLRVVHLDEDAGPPWTVVAPFLEKAAGAVSTIYGRFPRPDTQVIVRPVDGRGVRFGLVVRGGEPSVSLLVGAETRAADLEDDWVLVHEMSHLALPYVKMGNAWFYEGIATWYQEILRARAGWIDERTAWQNLHEGFERGERDAAWIPLAQASDEMHERRAYLHVYWAGTAIAALADLELRRRGRSLDAALAGLDLDNERFYPPEEVLAALDDDGVYAEIARAQLAHRGFPDLEPLYAALGLRVDGEGNIVLDEGAPAAEIRRAMTRPPGRTP